MQYLSTANLSTFLSIPLYLPTSYCQPVNLSPLITADLSTCLSVPLYLPTAYLSTTPFHLCSLTTADLSTVNYIASAYRRSAHPCPLTTEDLSTCLPIPLHLRTAYLSSADVSVFLFLCICQLPTCLNADLPTYVH